MTQNKEQEIEIVSTQKAAELFGCTVAWFHQNYRNKLTRVPSTDNRAYYLLEEIKKIIEEGNAKKVVEPKYKIIG